MDVRLCPDRRAAIIDPQGCADIQVMIEIKHVIAALLRDGHRILIIDCAGVERLQCRSLAILVERLCRARELGAMLALANLHPMLEARLRELRVDSLLPSFHTIPDALASLAPLAPERAPAA